MEYQSFTCWNTTSATLTALCTTNPVRDSLFQLPQELGDTGGGLTHPTVREGVATNPLMGRPSLGSPVV